MGRYYGIKEQKEALDYARHRMENEVSMQGDIDDLLSSMARLLVSMLAVGVSEDEIDSLVNIVTDRICEDCEILAVDEHTDERDGIIAFINREWGGMTLKERVRGRVRTFADEVALLMVVGKLLGKSDGAILATVPKNWDKPFGNPIIIEARDKVARGELRVPVSLDTPSYGQGVPVSSRKALGDICGHALAEGWGWYDYYEHKDAALGYVVQRGSSYPCDVCDGYVGYHDISDEESLPMYHNHCRCYVIWVYDRNAL